MYNSKRGKRPMRELELRESNDSLGELDLLLRQTTGGRPGGLSLAVTSLFILGHSSGAGILALPKAMEYMGPIGFLLMVICAAVAAYTAALLGHCWVICELRYPELMSYTPDPYAAIGLKSAGVVGRCAVQIFNNITILGSCVVYLLLIADLICDLTTLFGPRVPICYVVLIVGAFLIPLSWLGTPVDFWPVSYVASITTVVSCLLMALNFVEVCRSDVIPRQPVKHRRLGYETFLAGCGSLLYSFSGHMSYPTLQQDMKRRKRFGKAAAVALSVMLCLYLLVTVPSYIILGSAELDDLLSLLTRVSPGWMVYSAQIFIVSHLVSSYLLLFNPLCQEAEKQFHLPNKFTAGRVGVRTLLMVFKIFLAVTVPRFASIMSLIGGSSLALVTYILPVVFYECLCRRKGDWPKREIPLHMSVLHFEIVLVVGLVGIGATVAALDTIIDPATFVSPCYVNISAADSV